MVGVSEQTSNSKDHLEYWKMKPYFPVNRSKQLQLAAAHCPKLAIGALPVGQSKSITFVKHAGTPATTTTPRFRSPAGSRQPAPENDHRPDVVTNWALTLAAANVAQRFPIPFPGTRTSTSNWPVPCSAVNAKRERNTPDAPTATLYLIVLTATSSSSFCAFPLPFRAEHAGWWKTTQLASLAELALQCIRSTCAPRLEHYFTFIIIRAT